MARSAELSWQELELPLSLKPSWLGEQQVFIPLDPGEEACVIEGPQRATFGFDIDRAITRLETESWAAEMGSITQRLPFDYDRLPWFIRGLGALAIFAPRRLSRPRHHPTWPIAPALDVLRHLRGDGLTSAWPTGSFSFCLTCDVDSPAGWRRALELASMAESLALRVTFFVVGEVLDSEPSIGHELVARGHEIASHDVRHDNRLNTLDSAAMSVRLGQARESIDPFGGVGFRSPSLLRSPRLLEAIAEHFEYDSSVCDTDLEYARGVATVRPYALGAMCEIPITLPMDSSLRFTLHSQAHIAALWRRKCAWVRSLGGLATLAIHAEPQLSGGKRFREMVAEFLTWMLAEGEVEPMLARDVGRRAAGVDDVASHGDAQGTRSAS